MESHIGYIMTVSNSIIGVSILAMPFCFKQCGIILAILMLLASSFISRLTCHYLLKSANMARRRTFELLAFHTFGSMGKLIVELGIIGFLMGTCIAFFVIIGDLGPTIIAKILELNNTDTLRTTLLVCMAAFCVLPLGLLKNVESLSSVSTATIGFYFCLVLKTISESAGHIGNNEWMSKVELWRPAGILQCFPIFAMALSCQTQLFEIYDTLPNASLEKMNYVVRMAVNICVCVYICVGFFGYIAFASHPFTGNILMSFSPSRMTDVMKIGFVLSVACSFPLVIFPCRASLYSLLFRKLVPPKYTYACNLFFDIKTEQDDTHEQDEGYNPYEGISNFIPETRFKLLTFFIVGVSLIIGIMIPNIEVVLGLVGSTIGTLICVIFPVTCFICISTKNTNERILAQIMLFIGVIMMVMGTYANLYAMEESHTEVIPKDVVKLNQDNFIKNMQDNIIENINKPLAIKKESPNFPPDIKIQPVEKIEIRQEPPQPEEPVDIPKIPKLPPIELQPQKNINNPEKPLQPEKNKQPLNLNKIEPLKSDNSNKIDSQKQSIVESPAKVDVPPTIPTDQKSETIKPVEIDKAAIEKENEFLEEIDDKNKNEDLLEKLKKTKEELEKKKEELKIKEMEDKKENEKKMKAVSQLVEIAKKTLESLGKNPDIQIETNKENINKINELEKVVNSNKENEIEKKLEVNIEDNTNKNNADSGNKVKDVNKNNEVNEIIDSKNEELVQKLIKQENIVNIESKKIENEVIVVNKTVQENVIQNENVESKLKKLNSTIENMLPFPLKMLNFSNDKKNLEVPKVVNNEIIKLENKSGELDKKEKKVTKPELKNDIVVEEPKIIEKKEEIKVEKNEDVKKENDNKIGRDLLADLGSKDKEAMRKKREALENENCETTDKFIESDGILNKKSGILPAERKDLPSKEEYDVSYKPEKSEIIEKGDDALPENQNEIRNTLPNVNIPIEHSVENIQQKTDESFLSKENILPKQTDVLNSLQDNLVNLKISQELINTNFVNLRKRRK